MEISLSVCFEEPYWVGIFERNEDNQYSVSKITFGPEPTNPEVYEILLSNYYKLKFSMPIEGEHTPKVRVNPKRIKREINRTLREKGTSTKAQDALKQEFEKMKLEKKALSKEEKERIKHEQFELRMKKKKEKKKGH